MKTDIKSQWTEFLRLPFPDHCVAREVRGICLVSLDSFAAGCISSYLDGSGAASDSLGALERCRGELVQVLPHLDGDSRAYFTLLLDLIMALLQKTD